MKVNVIRADNPDIVMKMSLSGFKDEQTNNYFKDNYNRFVNRMGDHADTFVTAVKNVYSYVTNSNVLDSAKRALTRVDGTLNDKLIYHLDNETIHKPGLIMRKYVMANPILYEKFNNNLCSGYEDEWENTEQELSPVLRDDYIRVMDGYVGDESTIMMVDDNPLSTRERFMVHNAWDTVSDLIACGIDPTDFDKGEI